MMNEFRKSENVLRDLRVTQKSPLTHFDDFDENSNTVVQVFRRLVQEEEREKEEVD